MMTIQRRRRGWLNQWRGGGVANGSDVLMMIVAVAYRIDNEEAFNA